MLTYASAVARTRLASETILTKLSLITLFQCLFSSATLAFAQMPQPRVEEKDTTQDGRPDEWRFYEGDTLVRIERDRDGDGKREVWIYFKEGKPIRSEVDRNGDGKSDLIRFMENGRPVRDQADLNFDGKPDAWTFYKNGVKDLMIMDKNTDGRPDAWFYYGRGGTQLIGGRVDENFDGKIDRTFGAVPEKEERKPG